jgi:hypothetical protein
LALLVLIGAGVARSWRTALNWLARRPHYQSSFREIELSPAPPPWIKSGRAGLLLHVRDGAKWPERFSSLELDLGDLRLAFQRESPWVQEVTSIERTYPNRLVVHLYYREPVAYVPMAAQSPSIFLDREGVVLPDDDITLSAAQPLFEIRLASAPAEGRAGYSFSVLDKPDGQARYEPARAAARLAGFLKDKEAAAPIRAAVIHAQQSGLFVQTADGGMIFWGRPPRDERPGELLADQKWLLLRDWVKTHTMGECRPPEFLDIREGRVIIHNPVGDTPRPSGSGSVP